MEVTVQTPHRRSFGPAPAQTQMQATSGTLGTVQARQPQPESPPEPLPAPLPEPPPEPPIVEPANLRWLYGTVEYNPVAYGPGLNSLVVVGDRLPRRQDLTAFMDEYQKEDADGANVNIVSVGGNPPNLW